MHVVATAGHVDHGKSTLVLALTGTDPDRFAEEKRRGLTIDLGFAWTSLPSGAGIAFVDVPGHVRFLKNMLAGVGAVDACLFVVAATEGWKPQSEEHLRILELLGVQHGIVALTKVGIVDDDHAELARLDVLDHVAGTFLDGAEIVAVDAPTGLGLAQLRLALDRLLAKTPRAEDRDRPRLWVDRSFAAPGAGTVVTGTLAGGTLAVDDELTVVGAGVPGGERGARIRGLQSLGRTVAEIGPGNRVAVNLVGLTRNDVNRGDALIHPAQWQRTRTVDASLTVLAAVAHDVTRRGAYAVYVGSGEYPAKVRVLGSSDRIRPGSDGLVRLRLPTNLPLVPGDRFVVRESGRSETVGGGEILDVDPILAATRARPDRSVERVVAERGWVEATAVERLTGERREPTIDRWVVDPAALADMADKVRALVEQAGPLGLDVAALGERERAVLAQLDGVTVAAGRAVPAGTDDPLAGHPFVTALEANPFTPPMPDELGVDRVELRELIKRGRVVEQDGLYFAPAAMAGAAQTVARLLAAQPDGFTVAELRGALGTTRKWALPLLNHLDAAGVTRRRGDVRIAGPRLP
ncbi:MAG: selenocysteine-specific translation elongation factor, partial [Acidimicrobiales bacterium]